MSARLTFTCPYRCRLLFFFYELSMITGLPLCRTLSLCLCLLTSFILVSCKAKENSAGQLLSVGGEQYKSLEELPHYFVEFVQSAEEEQADGQHHIFSTDEVINNESRGESDKGLARDQDLQREQQDLAALESKQKFWDSYDGEGDYDDEFEGRTIGTIFDAYLASKGDSDQQWQIKNALEQRELGESSDSATSYERSSCAGVHIGGGYIITAAHCVMSTLMGCNATSNLGIHIVTKKDVATTAGVDSPSSSPHSSLAKTYIPFGEFKHIVVHQGAGLFEEYNMALIQVDPELPFAGEIALPTNAKYSSHTISGDIWIYGIGALIKQQVAATSAGSSHQPYAYFGGGALIDRKQPMSPIRSQTMSDQKMAAIIAARSSLKDLTQLIRSDDEADNGYDVTNAASTIQHCFSLKQIKEIAGKTNLALPFYGSIDREPGKFMTSFSAKDKMMRSTTDIDDVCAGSAGAPILQDNNLVGIADYSEDSSCGRVEDAEDMGKEAREEQHAAVAYFQNIYDHREWIAEAQALIKQGRFTLPDYLKDDLLFSKDVQTTEMINASLLPNSDINPAALDASSHTAPAAETDSPIWNQN